MGVVAMAEEEDEGGGRESGGITVLRGEWKYMREGERGKGKGGEMYNKVEELGQRKKMRKEKKRRGRDIERSTKNRRGLKGAREGEGEYKKGKWKSKQMERKKKEMRKR